MRADALEQHRQLCIRSLDGGAQQTGLAPRGQLRRLVGEVVVEVEHGGAVDYFPHPGGGDKRVLPAVGKER